MHPVQRWQNYTARSGPAILHLLTTVTSERYVVLELAVRVLTSDTDFTHTSCVAVSENGASINLHRTNEDELRIYVLSHTFALSVCRHSSMK